MRSRLSPTRLLVLAVLLGGIALRLAYLDADPDYYAWVGYITDEGRWVAHARELALFGHIVNTDWVLHLIVAPLFQAASYVAFKLLGVSIWSARLPTAAAGTLVLALFWLLLRRVVTAQALLVGLLLLALDVDLIELSRLSIPETAAMLAQLGVYAVVATGCPTPLRLFVGGLLLATTVAIKATGLPAIVIFSAIVFLQPIQDHARGQRWRSLLMLWAGFLAPLLSLAALGLVCCRDRAPALLSTSGMLGHFLKPSRPYGAASFFFDASFAPTLNIWAVGGCFSLVVWLLSSGGAGDPRVRRYFVTSAIWYGLYAPLMLSLEYFPDRYKAHILIPLAVNIATGISLVPKGSIARLTQGRKMAVVALLTLPTGVFWAPTLARIAAHAGMDAGRLLVRLACILIALLVTAWLVRRRVLAGRSPRIFIIFPIMAILGWMVCLRTGLDGGRFWPVPGGGQAAWWSVGVSATAVLAGLLAWVGRRWSAARWIALVPAAALCYSMLAVSRIAPSYVTPHYSIRQASQDLGLSLAGSPGVIGASRAEGLFNGNALPYRTVGGTWPTTPPHVIVIAFKFNDPEGLLGHEYRLVASYRLFVSPEYEDEEPSGPPVEVVRVYRHESLRSADAQRTP